MDCSTLAMRLRWVSAAAFGTPVVPPVWMRRAMSPGEAGHAPCHASARATSWSQRRAQAGTRAANCSRRSRAARSGRRTRNCEARGRARTRSIANTVCPGSRKDSFSKDFVQAMVVRAPWASYSPRSSAAGAKGLCSTTTAPRAMAPRTATACCGQFGMMRATRSPGRTPAAASAPAALRIWTTSSA